MELRWKILMWVTFLMMVMTVDICQSDAGRTKYQRGRSLPRQRIGGRAVFGISVNCPVWCSCRHKTVRCSRGTRKTLEMLPGDTQHLWVWTWWFNRCIGLKNCMYHITIPWIGLLHWLKSIITCIFIHQLSTKSWVRWVLW